MQRLYRLLAPRYDLLRPLWAGHRLGEAERFLEMDTLPGCLPGEGAVLDLGCGTGANLERLLRIGIPFSQYVGIDLSPAMIGRAKGKFGKRADVAFYLGNVQVLPFGDEKFDFALSTWVWEHVPQVPAALHEALRVLKKGAYLAVLFTSMPRGPLALPSRLLGPALRSLGKMRLMQPADYASAPLPVASFRFGGGFHTLLLFQKGAGH